ncbi:MAG TPA: tryptophanase [Bacteroidia bacterium]|nr:tryptophanase [Bacteroidia bacterium]
MKYKTIIEPFKIKMVEPIRITTEEERVKAIRDAGYNLFKLPSDKVMIDFLTDSGTSAMSDAQWAGMVKADESYAGSNSWVRMREVIYGLTGYPHIFPTHQGRAAERIVYGQLGGKGKVFISNTHFDTTRANIEMTGSLAFDIPVDESHDSASLFPFKGNMDIKRLTEVINEYGAANIGAVILTVTNNSAGGQPVSMANAKEVGTICNKHGIIYIIDCCRIAENAYFIKHKEQGYAHKGYKAIAMEMFALADGCIMSAKKDAIVNMGGFFALRDKKLADECREMLIVTEGYVTYGGLSGRDMEAIAIGLEEVFDADYLHYRISSTAYLGNKLHEKGVPVMLPIGGHAVYVDARRLYPHIPAEQLPGQALACELYVKGGIRSCEIGSLMFGHNDEQGKFVPAAMELVRLAIPRRVYTQSHIEYVIEVFDEILKSKEKIRGYKIVEAPRFLRHFTAQMEKI